MYAWIWRSLPGRLPARLVQSLLLLAAATAVLFLWVFPWVEARLPYSDVTVPGPSVGVSSSPAPSLSPSVLPGG